jgi:broad specificity phosphatase PhoE
VLLTTVTDTRPPIYFVRHGETEWNRLGLIQGWTDIPLNDKGHEQAKSLGRAFLAHPEVTRDCRFVVSPMGRTRQTMAHIAEALSLPESHVGISPSLKELGFGIWEGKPFWELKASPIYPADPETRYSWRPKDGESYQDGQERLTDWLKDIQDPTVIVSHGAIGRCLIGLLANLSIRDMVNIRTPQGCYCRLQNGQIDWFDENHDAA